VNHISNVRDLEQTHSVTWDQLVHLEPGLEALLRSARCAGAGCRKWSDVEGAFSPLRNTLVSIVGFGGRHHRHPVLGSAGAYEVAYWKLHEAVAGLLPRPAGATEATAETNRTPTAAAPLPSTPAAWLEQVMVAAGVWR
jgi:hypothetical protein